MKRLSCILFLSILIIAGCQKESNPTPMDINGTWNWIATYSDGAPGPMNPLTPANSGITQILSFNNNKYVLTQNSVVVSSGSFSTAIVKNSIGNYINQISYITPNSPPDSITYYQIFKDSLYFSYGLNGAVGSGSNYYIKK
jgi:hypothetical protein